MWQPSIRGFPPVKLGKGLRLLMKMGGYAAPRIAQALKKKGGNLVAPPEGFLVRGKEGPLKEGKLERGASWAQEMARSNTPPPGKAPPVLVVHGIVGRLDEGLTLARSNFLGKDYLKEPGIDKKEARWLRDSPFSKGAACDS